MDAQRAKGADFLFESSWKKPYSPMQPYSGHASRTSLGIYSSVASPIPGKATTRSERFRCDRSVVYLVPGHGPEHRANTNDL